MEQNEQNNKIRVSYIFKDNINRVFNFFTNVELLTPATLKCDKYEILQGRGFNELGFEIKFIWKNTMEIIFKVTEVVDTPDYKKVQIYTPVVKPFNTLYTMNWHFYNYTTDNSTFYVHEMIFDDVSSMKVMDLNHDYEEKLEMFRSIEKCLSKWVEGLDQVESILIPRPIDKVWAVMTNWVELSRIVPMIAEKVSYEGEPYVVGTKIHLVDSIRKTASSLQITKVEQEDEYFRKFHLRCYFGRPKSPLQDLQFEFVRVSDDSTFVSFKHVFIEPIKYELVASISKNKQMILKQVKSFMEKRKDKNYNDY